MHVAPALTKWMTELLALCSAKAPDEQPIQIGGAARPSGRRERMGDGNVSYKHPDTLLGIVTEGMDDSIGDWIFVIGGDHGTAGE